jgi:hypothetical protein
VKLFYLAFPDWAMRQPVDKDESGCVQHFLSGAVYSHMPMRLEEGVERRANAVQSISGSYASRSGAGTA